MCLNGYKDYISEFMPKIDFDSAAQQTFLNAIDLVSKNKRAADMFCKLLDRYEKDYLTQHSELINQIKPISELCGVHEYTLDMLLFLCMSKTLKRLYDERSIPENIFYDSMHDLSYKLNECRIIHKIDGTFVAFWYVVFFQLKCFALGRLQFELKNTYYEYTFRGKVYPVGSRVISIHIPRTGTPLNHQEVLESYKLAEKVFGSEFGDEPMLFLCDSWLLDPWLTSVLKPESNLVAFQNDFEIVKTGESYDYKSLWMVFDSIYTGDVDALPNDTTMRRAYIERIKRNEPFYFGHGLFFYKNGEFVK